MEMTDRHKAVLSTLLVLIFILILLLAAEGMVRVRQYINYGAFGDVSSFTFDETLGMRTLQPGSSTAHIQINNQGFRGPEIEQPKPAGRLRVGFLGASTTYCAEVSGDDAVWTQLVRDRLAEHWPAVTFDYVNGGVPGYTTDNSLTNLNKRVSTFQPDLVVIYHGTNDLSGETRDLANAAGIQRANLATEESWLARYSLLWALVEKNLALMAVEEAGPTETLDLDPESLGARFGKNLRELVTRARAHGAGQVALVTFAIHLREGMSQQQVDTAMASARYYMPYMTSESLLRSFTRYNEVIRQVARETGAILIEGENTIPGDPRHFADSVHFTDHGSERQADRILTGLQASVAFTDWVTGFGAH